MEYHQYPRIKTQLENANRFFFGCLCFISWLFQICWHFFPIFFGFQKYNIYMYRYPYIYFIRALYFSRTGHPRTIIRTLNPKSHMHMRTTSLAHTLSSTSHIPWFSSASTNCLSRTRTNYSSHTKSKGHTQNVLTPKIFSRTPTIFSDAVHILSFTSDIPRIGSAPTNHSSHTKSKVHTQNILAHPKSSRTHRIFYFWHTENWKCTHELHFAYTLFSRSAPTNYPSLILQRAPTNFAHTNWHSHIHSSQLLTYREPEVHLQTALCTHKSTNYYL